MNVGGPARHCVILGEGLREHGFETLLLAGDLDAGEVPFAGATDEGRGFRLEHIPGLGRPPSAVADARALATITRILRRERPHIVHTHTAKAGALGRVAARLAGVPIAVHTFHGHVLSGYFSPLRSHLITMAERALSRISARIVTLSPGLRDELAIRYRIAPRDQFEVVPLGRDLQPFADAPRGELRAELGLTEDAFLVGAVGRLVPIKRTPLLVRAFGALASADPHAHLVLVGDGPERRAVEAEAERLGLTARVHLLGWRRDLPQIYVDLDLLALSSRNEGTPLAIIEAFASGLPVVATAVGGVPDMFGRVGGAICSGAPAPPPGVALRAEGALVPAEDAVALGQALTHFAKHPALLEAAAPAARQASLVYSAERLVSDTAKLYRRLLNGAT